MTPLTIEILLHYYSRTDDYRGGDFSVPAVRSSMEWLESKGLLGGKVDSRPRAQHHLTERGMEYINRLIATPIDPPERPDHMGKRPTFLDGSPATPEPAAEPPSHGRIVAALFDEIERQAKDSGFYIHWHQGVDWLTVEFLEGRTGIDLHDLARAAWKPLVTEWNARIAGPIPDPASGGGGAYFAPIMPEPTAAVVAREIRKLDSLIDVSENHSDSVVITSSALRDVARSVKAIAEVLTRGAK